MPWRSLQSKVPLLSPLNMQGMIVRLVKSSLIFPASSILFGQPILGDTTPNSIRAQTPSARHTPVQKEVPFRAPSTLPSQPQTLTLPQTQTQLQPQQVQFRPRRQTEQTSSYDIDSWFNTFPPANVQTPQPLTSTSTDFFSSQVPPSHLDLSPLLVLARSSTTRSTPKLRTAVLLRTSTTPPNCMGL